MGTERGWFSLRRPLVVAVEDLPRAALRAPRSVARPRPRAPSVRPPLVGLAFVTAGESAPVVVVKVLSLALDLDFLSFGFDTSPHCEMVPDAETWMVSQGKDNEIDSDRASDSDSDSEGGGV